MVKTTTKAELILASKNEMTEDILFTFCLTFPRPILAEVNTHRVASRNTSSSRAIPGKKTRNRLIHDPFIPMSFGKEQKGMQAGAEITGWRRKYLEAEVRLGALFAAFKTWRMEKIGDAHKQVTNRYAEPYSWCQQVFSLTEVENLLLLRNHPDAEPHFQELAKQIAREVKIAKGAFAQMQRINMRVMEDPTGVSYKYQILKPGEWHLPYLLISEVTNLSLGLEQHKAISTARCARTSYRLLDTGQMSNLKADLAICDKLFGSAPMHLSPTEHPAEAMDESFYFGNFRGYRQFRKGIPGESGVSADQEVPF